MANLNAAFRRWFGNSVVRNEDGTPKVVYHWTPHNFSVFSKERIGSRMDMGDAGAGFYFYANADHTRFYGSRLISAYLRIEHPLVVPEGYLNMHERLGGTEADKKVADAFLGDILGIMVRHDPSFKPSRYRPAGLYHLVKDYGEHKFTEALIAEGYDGILYRNEYIVYESNQIKSTGNDGTWDLDDPDIYSNPYGDRRILSRQEAEAYVAAGSIPVTRTEGYTPVFFSEDAIAQQKGPWDWHGLYYFVGEDGDKGLPLGKTFIFNNKVDAMIQLGYSRKKVASKLHYYFDEHHKQGVTIDEFLKPYISGEVSRWYGDWADSFIAQQAKRNGADNVILLREPNAEYGYRAGTEVIDLHPVKTQHWGGVDLHEMFEQNPSDGPYESQNPALEDRGPEFFDFMVTVFDVRKAKQILMKRPREPVALKMDNVKAWIQFMQTAVDPVKAMGDNIDPTMPVIGAMVKFGKEKGVLPIDGWHRIYKAHKLGLESVPMFLLTDRESKTVNIHSNPDDDYCERLKRAYFERVKPWISLGRVGPGMKGIILADGKCVVWNAMPDGRPLGHMEVEEDILQLVMPGSACGEVELYGRRPKTNSILIELPRQKGQEHRLNDLEFMRTLLSYFEDIRPDTKVLVQVDQWRPVPKSHPTPFRVVYQSLAGDLENWEVVWDEWTMGWPVGTTELPKRLLKEP